MNEATSNTTYPVAHIEGPLKYVSLGTWAKFMNGKTFKGVYGPNGGIHSTIRDNIVSMGRRLATENIGYTVQFQVEHNVISSSSWVYPENILNMRCDGVVEYCYEWNGYRIYGNDSLWDISRGGHLVTEHHGGTLITPKKQPENYMTKIQSTIP